jgi:broad specificity phosphatase PhoE
MRLILVRHGRTAWNREERFRGRTDVPLDEVGEAQAEACGRHIATHFQPNAIYASPLMRTMRTAMAIARQCGLAVQPHEALLDMSFGEAEGLTRTEADARWKGIGTAWKRSPQLASFPGGENLDVVRARLLKTIHDLAQHHSRDVIVLVGHNATNRVLLLASLGLANEHFWRIGQEPTAINVIDAEDDEFSVIMLNDHCHLHQLVLTKEEKR